MSDFDMIAANPPGGVSPEQGPDPRFGQELQQALGQMREFQSRIVTQNKLQENPIAGVEKMEINKDGQMKATFHKDTFEALMKDHQELNQIRGAFHQEAERLRMQEQQARSQPWAQLATALSANLAQQKDMPGWVRAAGATAAQLNPTADELRNQRLATLSKEAEITEKAGALNIAGLRTESAETTAGVKATQADTKIHDSQLKLAQDGVKAGQVKSEEDLAAYSHLSDKEKLSLLSQAKTGEQTKLDRGKQMVADAKELIGIKAETTQKVQDELTDRRGKIAKEIANLRVGASREFLQERYKNIDARQAEGREFRAYTSKAEPGVLAVNNMRDSVSTLRQLIADHPEAVGPIEGRIPEILLTRDQAKVRAEFFTVLDAVRQQISGGTRFWNPQEFKNLSPKLAAALKTERVNLGILDALDDFSMRGAKNIVKSNPDIDWTTRAPVFGDLADKVIGQNKGGIQGKAGGSQSAGASSDPLEGRTATGPNGEKIIRKNGKWVPM